MNTTDSEPYLAHPTDTLRTASLGWRILQFVLAATVVVALQQVVEVWLLPGPSAELAVAQLKPSDAAADSLRLYETLRAFLPSVSAVLILFSGLVLFVPGFGRKAHHFIKSHR